MVVEMTAAGIRTGPRHPAARSTTLRGMNHYDSDWWETS